MAKTYGAENFNVIGNEDAQTGTNILWGGFKNLLSQVVNLNKSAELANSKFSMLFQTFLKNQRSVGAFKDLKNYFVDINNNLKYMDGHQLTALLQTTGKLDKTTKELLVTYAKTGTMHKDLKKTISDAGQAVATMDKTHFKGLTKTLKHTNTHLEETVEHLERLGELKSSKDIREMRGLLQNADNFGKYINKNQLAIIAEYFNVMDESVAKSLNELESLAGVIPQEIGNLINRVTTLAAHASNKEIKQLHKLYQQHKTTTVDYLKQIGKYAVSAAASMKVVFNPLFEAALELDKILNQVAQTTSSLMDPEARVAFSKTISRMSTQLGTDMGEVATQMSEAASDLALPYTATAAGIVDAKYGEINPALKTYFEMSRKLTKVADVNETSLRKLYGVFKGGNLATKEASGLLKSFASSLATLRGLNGVSKEDVDQYAESVSNILTAIKFNYQLSEDAGKAIETQTHNLFNSFNEFAGPESKYLIQDILKNLGSPDTRNLLLQPLGLSEGQLEDAIKNANLTPIRDALIKKFMYIEDQVAGMPDHLRAMRSENLLDTMFGSLSEDPQRKTAIMSMFNFFRQQGRLSKLAVADLFKEPPPVDEKYKQMAATISSVIKKFEQLGKRLLGIFGAPLIEKLSPYAEKLGNIFVGVLNYLDSLSDTMKIIIGSLSGLLVFGTVSKLIAGVFGTLAKWFPLVKGFEQTGKVFGLIGKLFVWLGGIIKDFVLFKWVKSLYSSAIAFLPKISTLLRGIPAFFAPIGTAVTWLGGLFVSLGKIMWSSLVTVFSALGTLVAGLAKAIGGAFVAALTSLVKVLRLAAIWSWLVASPWAVLVLAIAAVALAVYGLHKAFQYLFGTDYIDKSINYLTELFGKFWATIKEYTRWFLDIFTVDNLLWIGKNIFDAIKSAFLSVKEGIWSWLGFSSNPAAGVTQATQPTIPTTNPLTNAYSPSGEVSVPATAGVPAHTTAPAVLANQENQVINNNLLAEALKILKVIADNTKETTTKAAINTWTSRPFTDSESYTQSIADSARRSNVGG